MRVQVVHQRYIFLLWKLLQLLLAAVDGQVWHLIVRLRRVERLVADLVEGHACLELLRAEVVLAWFPLVDLHVVDRRVEVLGQLWVVDMLSFLLNQKLPCACLAEVESTLVEAQGFVVQVWVVNGVIRVQLVPCVEVRLTFERRWHFLVSCCYVIVAVNRILISGWLWLRCAVLVGAGDKVAPLSHHLRAPRYHSLCLVRHDLAVVLGLTT